MVCLVRQTQVPSVRLRSGAFRAWMTRLNLGSVDDQAGHLGISRAQLYQVIAGATPGEKFIAAVVAAGGTFDDLFEVAS